MDGKVVVIEEVQADEYFQRPPAAGLHFHESAQRSCKPQCHQRRSGTANIIQEIPGGLASEILHRKRKTYRRYKKTGETWSNRSRARWPKGFGNYLRPGMQVRQAMKWASIKFGSRVDSACWTPKSTLVSATSPKGCYSDCIPVTVVSVRALRGGINRIGWKPLPSIAPELNLGG